MLLFSRQCAIVFNPMHKFQQYNVIQPPNEAELGKMIRGSEDLAKLVLRLTIAENSENVDEFTMRRLGVFGSTESADAATRELDMKVEVIDVSLLPVTLFGELYSTDENGAESILGYGRLVVEDDPTKTDAERSLSLIY